MDALRSHPPFDKLDDQTLRVAGTEVVSLRTGKALYYQGDRAVKAYLVLEGAVRSVMYRSDDTSLDLGTQESGDWLGLPELILAGPALTDAVSLGCRVLAVDRHAFAQLRTSAVFEQWLTGELARRCYALHARVELAQPGQRLARWLAAQQGPRGVLLVTQDEVAAAVGTSRETVNRHLGRMQAEGLVRLERGRITVVNAEALGVWGGE